MNDASSSSPAAGSLEEIGFDPSQFASIETEVTAQNATTGIPIRCDSANALCEVEERSIALEVQNKSCATGHNLLVEITMKVPKGPALKFVTTTRVTQIEHLDETLDKVYLTLVQFQEEAWQKVLEVFQKRQESIENYLVSAKGY
jgi:hypothetical protein